MREEEVRGLFARTLDTPPVPSQGTDEIIAAGRRVVTRRKGFAYTAVTAAALAAVIGIGAIVQPGGGVEGADSPKDFWDSSGVADVNYEYSHATSTALSDAADGRWYEAEDVGGPPTWDWNTDRSAIASDLNVRFEDEDTQRLTITVQEPRPDADVDERLMALAECEDDCVLTDVEGGRRLLTREDRFEPDSSGPRNRHQALVARADGTIVTASVWVEDPSPAAPLGEIVLTSGKLADIVQFLPEIQYAPVGTVSTEEASAAAEAPVSGDQWAHFLDVKLEDGITSRLPNAVLTDDADSPEKLGYRVDPDLNGYRSRGTIVLPTTPGIDFVAETFGPIEEPFDKIEELAGCADLGGCTRTDITDSAYFTAEGPNSISVWAVRDSGLIARLTLTSTTDAPPPLTPEQVIDIVMGIPAPTN